MFPDTVRWKENWPEVRDHYERWWRREGPILLVDGLPELESPRSCPLPPPEPPDERGRNLDPAWAAWNQRASLARLPLPADNLPIAHVEYGCVQLAAVFGSEPTYQDETVWYAECVPEPDRCPPLRLTGAETWWRVYESILLELVRVADGDFLVGAPAFGSNLDVLAELRGTQNLLFDLLDRPDWVRAKLAEINDAFFAAFDAYYERIRMADGSSAYTWFRLWGPGRTSQVQCDFAAMISPSMFREYVVPPLRDQCAWLDHSLFHLDGPQCIGHLEALLEIEELDAVQWTPGAGHPGAGDPAWDDLYGQVLRAGKAVQVLHITPDEARRVLERFGPRGVFLLVHTDSRDEANALTELVDALR